MQRRFAVLRLYLVIVLLLGVMMLVGRLLADDEIAFTSGDRVYRVDVRTRCLAPLNLPTRSQLRALGWSPDGAALLIHEYEPPAINNTMIYRPRQPGWQRLAPSLRTSADMRFAADSAHVYFTDSRSLFRAALDDMADWQRIYSFGEVLTYLLALAPDGREAAILGTDQQGAYHIFLVDLVTGSMTPGVIGDSYAWSPDGTQAAYSNLKRIYLLDTQTQISTFITAGYAPVWSPNGEWIALLSPTDPHELVLHHLADGHEVTLVHARTVIRTLAWRPTVRS